jgi:hypothetical protein
MNSVVTVTAESKRNSLLRDSELPGLGIGLLNPAAVCGQHRNRNVGIIDGAALDLLDLTFKYRGNAVKPSVCRRRFQLSLIRASADTSTANFHYMIDEQRLYKRRTTSCSLVDKPC